jgi:assimilatory nitrate reductase catalytic subunit
LALHLKSPAKGTKLIVIDPFQSQTALVADRHIQLMPGTDVVLALQLIHVILSEHLQDQDYIDRYTFRIKELEERL